MNQLINENKVIFIDWGLFLHRAIFGWETQRKRRDEAIAIHGYTNIFVPSANYLCMSMVLGCLKLVGVNRDDYVVVCIDGRGNWRKDVDPQYKANRKALKDADQIDWISWYKIFDEMVEKLKLSTPFTYIRIDKLEADDLIAVGVKHFQDKECIIISSDSDFEQLTAYKNVKLFSPLSKSYKIVKNAYAIIASKLKKEKTDNLVSPIIDEADFKRRNMLVNLLELPDYVETKALDELKKVAYNDYNLEYFPFPNLREKFSDIYNSKKVVSFEKSLKKKAKKIKIKKDEIRNGKRHNLQDNPKIKEW